MKKLMVIGIMLTVGLGLNVASATDIDGVQVPAIIDTAGDYQLTWADTLFVNYERATTAADSAKVDTCLIALSIFQINAGDVTLNGNGKVLVGPGGADPPEDTHDVQPLWPNRTYRDSLAMDNIRIHDLTIMYGRTGVYLTKLSNSLLENVTVKECYRGIYPHSKPREVAAGTGDGAGGRLAVADTIRNCTVENFFREGIAVRGEGHQLLNNTITFTRDMETYDRGSAGIAIQRSSQYFTTGILVQGNTIDGGSNLQNGIYANRSGTNAYADNTISDVTVAGVHIDGHASNGRGDENTFTNTIINLAAVDSAAGIWINGLTDNCLFDGFTIDSAGIGILTEGATHANIFQNGTLDGSSIADVSVLENSNVFMVNTPFGRAGSMVEPGSAIFFGEGFTVDLTVTTPWEIPVGPFDVTVTNGIGDTVATFAVDANGIDAFKVAEMGVSANIDTMRWGAQNPYTLAIESGDLYSSYAHELTATLTADTSLTIDMDIDWYALPVQLVTSEEYTLSEDTLMVNYLWAQDAADSAAVMELILAANSGAAIIQPNADHVTFDGNGGVIYGPNVADDDYDVQAIFANRAYADTTELTNITVTNATFVGMRSAIYLTKVRKGLVEDCTIEEAKRGVYVNAKRSADAEGTIVTGNTLINMHSEAITIRGPNAQVLDNTITANRVLRDSKATGIAVQRSLTELTTGILVQGNTVNGNSLIDRGIEIDRSGGNLYVENVINAVSGYGLWLNTNVTNGRADDNTFIRTAINLAGPDSAIGIFFDDADFNVIDTVMVDSAGVLVKSVDDSRGNVIAHALFTNGDPDGYDVVASDGSSVYFAEEGAIDPTRCMIEAGSAVFFGAPLMVDLEVLLENSLALAGMEVIVTNAAGDEVGNFTTDEDGMAYIDVGASGISSSGSQTAMNPYTLSVVHDLDDGFSGLLGSATVTVTENVAITLNVDYLALEAAKVGLPKEFALAHNYPNPFNPSTSIPYALPVNARVSMRVYDVTGRLIQTLVNGDQTAGYHRVIWDGTDNAGRPVASGIYLFELNANDFRQVNKMMLLK
jgi:hypothetical protein